MRIFFCPRLLAQQWRACVGCATSCLPGGEMNTTLPGYVARHRGSRLNNWALLYGSVYRIRAPRYSVDGNVMCDLCPRSQTHILRRLVTARLDDPLHRVGFGRDDVQPLLCTMSRDFMLLDMFSTVHFFMLILFMLMLRYPAAASFHSSYTARRRSSCYGVVHAASWGRGVGHEPQHAPVTVMR